LVDKETDEELKETNKNFFKNLMETLIPKLKGL
jgi:hypothetical protein